jgi:hypothetical protein
MQEKTTRRLQLLMPRLREWQDNDRAMPDDMRIGFSLMVASCFPEFEEFAEIGMAFLGFRITKQQRAIARKMQHGSKRQFIAAQRGEAKSTLAGLFAVWCLIRDQDEHVLIVSGGEKQASDVAIMVLRLIEQWPMLCWLRPDPGKSDRTSFQAYDVHCSLRRVDKSPSVACVGITAQLQGKRATLLIPDDIETTKNSLTQPMREQILMLSKEFGAIAAVDWAKIMYLGTPQTKDSVYKTLPSRGYEVCIWPGRYPTNEEIDRMGRDNIAPDILEAAALDPSLQHGGGLDGTRGKPSDPERYSEEAEQEKELDYGPEGYQLQFMLDTSLSDAARTKIKVEDILFARLDGDRVPERFTYAAGPQTQLALDLPWNLQGMKIYQPGAMSDVFRPFDLKYMVVDPAGSGGDEVAYGVGGVLNGYVHLLRIAGLRGGMAKENCRTILKMASDLGVAKIFVEANQGVGMARLLMLQELTELKNENTHFPTIGVEDYYSKGQKERRIIDTISPLTRKHKLVVHWAAVESDRAACELHDAGKRKGMSVFRQLADITYDRNCLVHDDRADIVQKLCEELGRMIVLDEEAESEKRALEDGRKFMADPMGRGLPARTARGTRNRLRNR